MSATVGRVLIVDDDPDVLEMLRLYLTDGPFEVMTAISGADAVAVARRHRPDAVLLDITAPADGMSRAEAVRALSVVDPSMAVVVVTANRDDMAKRDVATTFDYVLKPFDFDVLDDTIMAAVTAGARSAWPARRAIAS